MFRNACARARQFTYPVIFASKRADAKCFAGLGALVIVNPEGWIVTAAHIVTQAVTLHQSELNARNIEQNSAAIAGDKTLSSRDRGKKLAALPKLRKTDVTRAFVFWAFNGSRLVDINVARGVDLAVGRLQPFNPADVTEYPVFKDPAKDFETGTSLCKYGYPFHEITPTWDEARQSFDFPKFDLAFFPMEGIFTRTVNVDDPTIPPSPFPLRYVDEVIERAGKSSHARLSSSREGATIHPH
jgi:hypothetical protein